MDEKRKSKIYASVIAVGLLIVGSACIGACGEEPNDDRSQQIAPVQNVESGITNDDTQYEDHGENIDTQTEVVATPETESIVEIESETEFETETESEAEEPLGFKVIFSRSYRNDVTGRWRLAQISENISIEEYAVDYYNNYFSSDDEVHIVINTSTRTTACITYVFGMLDIRIMEYVDGEERDAKIACTGNLISEYQVDINTGNTEKIQ